MQEQLTSHRRNLHRIPEIMFDLPKTKAYILDALKHVSAQIGEMATSGLSYFFDAGKPSTVAFRTDMDALEIEEQTGASFASIHPGKMHACGHDAHMAIMLAFADHVNRHIHELPHNVLLIFQPAEESGGGARQVVESGILARHRVSRIYALHIDPRLMVGEIGSRPGAFMARPSEVWLHVTGKATHVARAEEGIDATAACVAFYNKVTQMERAYKSQEPKLLKFGLLQSGLAQNIISGTARLGGTMRTFSEQDYEYMKARILEAAEQVQAESGAQMDAQVADGYPALINDPALFEQARQALSDQPFITFDRPNLLGEDFSYYLKQVPGLMLYIGVGSSDPLHSSTLNYDERALMTGLTIYKRLCRLPNL
ncbi:amidohydrolase [Eubacteriales bacterium OttesenSCG-928-N13]|nr:amidohydrolase [Eubacteriales bacterium OttesenSCG-928-N13]